MPLPIPDLDDRRFDELSAELQARLLRQIPELTQISPGDPIHALVDMFAWLTETVIYRANRIPERQRRAFLNLLQIPLRAARPARGLVCIDSTATQAVLPALLRAETALSAGQVSFSTLGELQPTPLTLRILVKASLDIGVLNAEGISLAQLRHQYGVEPHAFRPVSLLPGRDLISSDGTVDDAVYLAIAVNKPQLIAQRDKLLRALAGIILNIGLAPETDIDAELAGALSPRHLSWDLAWWPDPDKTDEVTYLPLEVVSDSSQGGRRSGVARLRLPRTAQLFSAPDAIDPQFAGFKDTPPELPGDLAPGQLLFWLRLRCADDSLNLAYLDINASDVEGVGVARDLIVGSGTGRPGQTLALPHTDIDADSVVLDIEEQQQFVVWQQVSHLAGSGPDDRVFVLEPSSGEIRFGDGLRGKRPPANARIRAALYRHGGGSHGNLPGDSITALATNSGKLKVRQPWPTSGGVDRESIEAAETRIPAFLNHRERAVTAEDFTVLAVDNPLRPVAHADAVPGFFPGASLGAVRRNVPGVISVFVLPPQAPALATLPQPTAGMLREVYDYLIARTLLGTELYVLSPQYQPIAVSVALEVVDPATEQQTFRAVEQALLHYLWPLSPHGPRGAGWPYGRSVEINELRTQAGRVAGIEAVNGLRLFYQDLADAQWRELSGAQALPLLDYQLPQLMAVTIQAGEAQPPAPRGFAPGAAPSSGKQPVPVPVIPDLC